MKVKILWKVELIANLVQSVISWVLLARDGCEWSKSGYTCFEDASGVLTPLPADFLHKVAALGFWNIVHGSHLYSAKSWMAWNSSQEGYWADVHKNDKWLYYEWSVGRGHELPAVPDSTPK